MPKTKTAKKDSRSPQPQRTKTPGRKVEAGSQAAPSQEAVSATKGFSVVGLGASAGGLEALEDFFTHMPPDSGMAFVVVTHQHPGHASMLPELLRKCTAMPVAEAENNMRVKPNSVYVARPAGNLAILRGRLQLMDSRETTGMRLPIDYFFRSNAEDSGERAVGIILSGTASDGTLGVKAIKGATGMTMAQEPETAKYASMPNNAIATGLVDFVLPAGQLPKRLLAYAASSHLSHGKGYGSADGGLSEPMLKIIVLLRSRTGHDFSNYKPTTLRRRIERRMNLHRIKEPLQYLSVLQDNPHEVDLLFKELLISVTNFFRDPEVFDVLGATVLRQLLETKEDNATVRVWVPGCATGEEAYSLAILLRETAERLKRQFTFQIFGTDLDSQAIDVARTGVYPHGIAVDLSPERLARFFTKEDSHYRIRKEIRELVVFAPQNVCKDPPFTRLDFISCRNLLIYLNPSLQKRLLGMFHYALKSDGLMLLGPSESVGDLQDHFAPVDKKVKVFRKTGPPLELLTHPDLTADRTDAARPTTATKLPARAVEPRLTALFEKLLLGRFTPASVIVNSHGEISYIHGRTGKYLEPASGRPQNNIVEMAREGLRLALASCLRRASTQKSEVVQAGIQVKTNGNFTSVDVAVSAIKEPESLRGLFLVTFRDSMAPAAPEGRKGARQAKAPQGRVEELEEELLFTKESLQGTIEEMQTTGEELKSSNEELQSTNEELQSTNEELETSKEEMQSLNEELQTVNAQLQSKVEAHTRASDDMQNLLNSTSIATVFLDGHMRIRRFTDDARQVFKLIPGDVGRPIADLVSNLDYDRLVADAHEVLRTLKSREVEVPTRDGHWRLVRILPYRTTENMIDGLVITLADITRTKLAEQAADHGRAYAESIVSTVREPLLVLDKHLRVVSANRAFYRKFQTETAGTEGRLVYELGNGQWDIPALRKLLEKVLPKKSTFDDFEVTHEFPGIGRRIIRLNARRVEQHPTQPGLILLAMEDVSGPHHQIPNEKKPSRK
jgi:two-component system CheB/CheR fusion protein